MDKLTHYQNIIINVLTDYYDLLRSATTIGASEVRDELITDLLHNHFQLVSMGWQKQRFFHETHIHIDIIDNQIWVQQNNTEFDVVAEMISKGIDKQAIVLGFIPPDARNLAGFTVA